MTTKRYLISLLPVLLWLVSLPVQAAVEAGRILFARGTVSIVDASNSARGGSVGSVFYEGDRVVTGNKSIVQLRLSDGALTALRSNSDYQIQRQRYDEPAQVYEQAGRLVAGWMRSVTGAIGAKYPGNVQQGTSVATIGIRGTTYQVIHVPPEGLPEFPNLQPGSYVYLEDGQIEVSNEAGSRIVSPGQVVRITGANVEPELMPELVELFQSQLLASLEGDDGEGFSVRDLLEDEQEQIVDNIGSGAAVPFSGTVSGVGAFGGFVAGIGNSSALVWEGEGTGRYASSMTIASDNGETISNYDLAETGEFSPHGLQYRQIGGREGLASQIHWGFWLPNSFTAFDADAGAPFGGDPGLWHFMIADNVLENGRSDIANIGLTGRYAYSYIGGTELNGFSDGSPTSELTTIERGKITVDFASMFLDVDMEFLVPTEGAPEDVRLVGSASIDDFYSSGIYLSPLSDQQFSSGNIQGMFVGQFAEGIISSLTLYDGFLNEYYGTAAFQMNFNPANVFGGVSGLETLGGRSFVLNPFVLQTGSNAGGVFADEIFIGEFSSQVLVSGNSSSPTEQLGGVQIYKTPGDAGSGLATEVYWGIWDTNEYTIRDEFDNNFQTTSDWHYMVASNPLNEDMLLAIGLTGTYDYNLAGGTPLREVAGATGDLVLDPTSTIRVDFDSLFSGGIQVDLGIAGLSMVGNGSLFDLYGTGIGLADAGGDPLAFGSLAGTFAGNQAEALATVVTYDYNTESYIGTALFEKDPTPVVVP